MTPRKWRLLTLALAAVVGVLVLVPPVGAAVRSTPELLNEILAAVGAVKANTDKLPADPAAASDVRAATAALSSQIHLLPFSAALRRTLVDTDRCAVISGPIDAGRERSITISVESANVDAEATVNIDHAASSLTGYGIRLTDGVPLTFVETQTGAEIVRLCNNTNGSAMFVSAIWTEGPAS